MLDGFFQGDPEPADNGIGRQVAARLPVPGAGPHAGPAAPLAIQPGHRSGPGGAADRHDHRVRHDQRRLRRRRATATRTPPPASPAGSCSTGWSGTTCVTGSRAAVRLRRRRVRQRDRDGAPGRRSAEDDGYLVTLTTDMNDDASYCLVFDAARVGDGPVCKIALPERISSGTHSTWARGSELRRWRRSETAARAIGL